MTKPTLVVSFLVLSVVLLGCGKEDYEYISLVEEMAVVKYGRAEGNFGNLVSLRGHSDMPIRYQLNRDDYTLYADIDRWSNRPAVIFSVDSFRDPKARLIGTQIVCFASFRELYPFEVDKYGNPPGAAIFSWGPVGDVSSCSQVTMPDPENYWLEVSIVGQDEKIIAIERLDFEIKSNGWYWWADSL
jgi:hypothetical protein